MNAAPDPATSISEDTLDLLATAILNDDAGLLEQMLDTGIDVNTVLGERGRPLLTQAIADSSTGCACLLVRCGAEIGRTAAGIRPLILAARLGNEDVCRALLDAGALIDDCGLDGKTALYEAVAWKHPSVCALLVERGADVHCETTIGILPLNAASMTSTPLTDQIVRTLTGAGADHAKVPPRAHAHGRIPLSAFQVAVKEGNIAHVDYYLQECGADPVQKTTEGTTMLELATKADMRELLRSAMVTHGVTSSLNPQLGNQQKVSGSKGLAPL